MKSLWLKDSTNEIRISYSEAKIFFVIEGPPLGISKKFEKLQYFQWTQVKNFFRPISDSLYCKGSKNTNLMSGEFCQCNPVAPATCVLTMSISASPLPRLFQGSAFLCFFFCQTTYSHPAKMDFWKKLETKHRSFQTMIFGT